MDISNITNYNTVMTNNKIQSLPLNDMRQELPDEIFNSFAYLSSVYGASALINAISKEQNCSPDTAAFSPHSYGKDRFIFCFCDEQNKNSIDLALSRAARIDTGLVDYKVKSVSSLHTNDSFVLTLPQDENVQDYKQLQNPDDASLMSRKILFKDIEKLAKEGVAINPTSIYYNQDKDKFKLLNLSGIKINCFESAAQREDYLNMYRKFYAL